jgi:hypothetical protein
MDGFVRAVGGGIGGFFANAAAAVGNAIHTVFTQLERVVPGGALPVVLLAILVAILAWNLLRH